MFRENRDSPGCGAGNATEVIEQVEHAPYFRPEAAAEYIRGHSGQRPPTGNTR